MSPALATFRAYCLTSHLAVDSVLQDRINLDNAALSNASGQTAHDVLIRAGVLLLSRERVGPPPELVAGNFDVLEG